MRRAQNGLIPITVVVLLLNGCALGPAYERPDLVLPDEWPSDDNGRAPSDTSELEGWWERFDDPVLNELITQALENNPDLEQAAARVAEARAVLGFRRAEQLPQLTAEGEFESRRFRDDDRPSRDHEVAGILSYELDLWGRLSGASRSARAQLLSTAYTRDAIQLAVKTDVVVSYFEYRAAQDQIRIARETIEAREEALELEDVRRRAGAATQLALRQAAAELETSRAELPGRVAEARRLSRALAILVGDDAAVMSGLEQLGDEGLERLTQDERLLHLPEYVPSELLEQRPDLRAAEAILVASHADIAVARANWFPRINLSAIFGTAATSSSALFSGPSSFTEYVAGLSMPILDFGRRAGEISTAEARRELAEAQYRTTVMQAFQDVGDAWTLMNTAEERRQARSREVAARRDVLGLAETRYIGGYTEYLEVLDARRALFSAEIARTEAARDQLVSKANLFRALGGGWSPGDELSGQIDRVGHRLEGGERE